MGGLYTGHSVGEERSSQYYKSICSVGWQILDLSQNKYYNS